MLLAIVGTLLHHGIVDYKWIAVALVLGSIIGAALGRVQMTAVPQRTALVPRLRRALRHAGRHRRILPASARRAAVHDGGAVGRGHPGLAHVHRQPDGRRQAPGDLAAAADHLQGAELSSISRSWRSPSASPSSWSFIPSRPSSFTSCWSIPHALRRADDHPDRRRRHADGDLAAQFLRRAFGRGDGVRARQQAA